MAPVDNSIKHISLTLLQSTKCLASFMPIIPAGYSIRMDHSMNESIFLYKPDHFKQSQHAVRFKLQVTAA